MPVSFLDLVPKARTETVTIDTESHGPQEIELAGITHRDLAALAKRFPEIARVLDYEIQTVIENPDALTAVIAASMGHLGDKDIEARLSSFPLGDIVRMGRAVVRVTFPEAAAPSPLPQPPSVSNGVDAAPEATSPAQLNS